MQKYYYYHSVLEILDFLKLLYIIILNKEFRSECDAGEEYQLIQKK